MTHDGGLPELPESFYIDEHGKVVLAKTGASSKGEIEANIVSYWDLRPE
jgi:hypothetical protein